MEIVSCFSFDLIVFSLRLLHERREKVLELAALEVEVLVQLRRVFQDLSAKRVGAE